jgi:hypothetical protein
MSTALFCSEYMTQKFMDDMQKGYEKKRDLEVQCVDHGIIHPLEISYTGGGGRIGNMEVLRIKTLILLSSP